MSTQHSTDELNARYKLLSILLSQSRSLALFQPTVAFFLSVYPTMAKDCLQCGQSWTKVGHLFFIFVTPHFGHIYRLSFAGLAIRLSYALPNPASPCFLLLLHDSNIAVIWWERGESNPALFFSASLLQSAAPSVEHLSHGAGRATGFLLAQSILGVDSRSVAAPSSCILILADGASPVKRRPCRSLPT